MGIEWNLIPLSKLKKKKKKPSQMLSNTISIPYLHLNETCYTFNMFQGAKLISHH